MICALGLRRENFQRVHVQHKYTEPPRTGLWNGGGHIVSFMRTSCRYVLRVQHSISDSAGFSFTPDLELEP